MGINSLERLKSSLLYKELINKETEEKRTGKLSSKIEITVETISPLLHRIPENMPEYTLHDPNHSVKIIEIIGKFLPLHTLHSLNSIELCLIILAAYLHDIGMTSSKDEREAIIADNTDYNILFKTLNDKKEKYDYYVSAKDHRSATFIQDQVYTEYLRKYHVVRSASYITENLSKGAMALEIDGIPFWKQLVAICNGHGESVKTISDVKKYPRQTLVGETVINVQFLSLILRLGDILDLDPERTPKVIYEYLDPKDPISLIEWKKHRSIIGYSIKPESILFEAECTSPEVERALREFISWIEIERKETMQLLKDVDSKYELKLTEPITTDRIRSDESYVYNDLKFEIDYKRVMELLMGQRLYRSPIFSIRELLQNSNDAIKARQSLYDAKGETFVPKIILKIDHDILSIEDNGIGMDINTFKNYFLQIGKSLYSSADFYYKKSDVDVTSEFGIGVLSAFMIATSMTVESRRQFDSPDNPPQPILFEIPTAHSYTIQKKTDKQSIGTKITLRLKSIKPFNDLDIKSILELLIPDPPFPIQIEEFGKEICFHRELSPINIPVLPSKIERHEMENYMIDDFEQKEKYSHSFCELDFTKSTNEILKNITGKLYFVNSGRHNWYSIINGFFSQRNFNIGSLEDDQGFKIVPSKNLKNVFPAWLSYYSTLNLTRTACLSLTPDRTDVILDEKYNSIKVLIENEIINHLTTNFENYIYKYSESQFHSYTDLLLSTGYISIDLARRNAKLSSNALNFLNQYLTFPVVDEKGARKRLTAKEISEYDTIGYITSELSKDGLARLVFALGGVRAIILDIASMEYKQRYHRLERIIYSLFVEDNKDFQSIMQLTYTLPYFTVEIIKYKEFRRKRLDYNVLLEARDVLAPEAKQLLCINRHKCEYFILLNANHPLLIPLFDHDLEIKPNAKNIIDQLRDLIEENVEKSVKQNLTSRQEIHYKDLYTPGNNVNYYELNKSLMIEDPGFLDRVNAELNAIWADYITCNFVPSSTKPYILTEDDFPKSWSEPI